MLKAWKVLIAAVLLASWFSATPASAISPMEQVKETVQQVLTVVAGSPGDEVRRRNRMRETLMPRFDWFEMAKQSLGKHWSSASGREKEFVSAFAAFLGNSYVGQIDSYRNEKILFVKESIENNQAQVKTKIIAAQGEPTTVDYRLHRVHGEWKIYDVVIEDISIVGNYRAQFSRVLARGSLDDLMRQFREKEAKSRN